MKYTEEIKYKLNQLKQRQMLPLYIKEKYSEKRIKEWYKYNKGNVYISFSGGKDSNVLLHLVRRFFPDVEAVFCNTGLEHPEILKHVKKQKNVTWIKPEMTFKDVLEKYGFPVISKKVARQIRDIQNANPNNKATVNLRLTGYNKKNVFCPSQKLPKKWLKLAKSDIKVSEQCCDIMKKKPFKKYIKKTGKLPYIGLMAEESKMREKQYINQGCNAFDSKTNPCSIPLAFWTEADIYEYAEKYKINFSKAYETEKRTGCMFCMFGVHLEKGENRFQRMKRTQPKYYDYCINKLGCGRVLDFIGVEYRTYVNMKLF